MKEKIKRIKTEKISVINADQIPEGYIQRKDILPGEVEEVVIRHILIKGPGRISEVVHPGIYDVILTLKGSASIKYSGCKYSLNTGYIAKMPYNRQYDIEVGEGEKIDFLLLRKTMKEEDIKVITSEKNKHSDLYIKALADCPSYTEDIKSSKTINKMILPEGMVPRFCMGSVKTTGPDEVGEHEHPVLDQLFFGLERCKCTCMANGQKTFLTENMMLHIPLGSKHSVSVKEGDTLSYIWLDFFLTTEGQKYMSEQHKIEGE